jgi:probable phosphoglycerate mutase
VDPDLAEWNYGDFEGLVRSQIDAIKPGWNIFRDGCPGGETAADVSARADRVVARLRQGQGDYAVFTHGHFGRAFAARWLGFGLVEADRLLLATASVGILSFERGDRSCPAIELWNLPPDGALPRA